MKALTKRMVALAGVLALGLTFARAQSDGALLDALVQKGVLTDQEAEDIRASEAKDYATTPAGKFILPDHVTSLKLYGDARLRWDYLNETPQAVNGTVPTGAPSSTYSHDNVVARSRFRLRVGADYTFTDKFNAGFELESGPNNDSANQTFGNAYNKYGINIGLVYLQWKPTDWLTLTGGKQRNPLYTTDLVWDPDINPEGGSEVMSWTMPVDFGSSAPASTDPKAVAPVSEPSNMSFTIGLTAFQGIYADNNEFNAAPAPGAANNNATDVWQFVEQVPVQFNFDKTTFIKEVPGFDSYMSGGNTTGGAGLIGGGGATVGGGGTLNYAGPNIADHLEIFTAPGEFDWKSWDIPFRVYWDFALNTDGKARIQDVYLGRGETGVVQSNAVLRENQGLGDNVAWLAGLQVGQNKKKGDWSIKGDFRQTGLGSVDPNLNDSDFADSFLNQQGFKIQSTYNFTDFLTGSVTFYDTWNYKTGLLDGSTTGQNPAAASVGGTGLPIVGGAGYVVGGPSTGVTGLAGASSTERVQVDLMWKF